MLSKLLYTASILVLAQAGNDIELESYSYINNAGEADMFSGPRLVRIPFTQPALIDGALKNLEQMQSSLLSNSRSSLEPTFSRPFSQGIQLLQTLSPFSLDDFFRCKNVLPKPSEESDYDYGLNQVYTSTSTSSPSFFGMNNSSVLGRLAAPFTAPLTALTNRVTSPLFNQILDILQPRSAQEVPSGLMNSISMLMLQNEQNRCRRLANSPAMKLQKGVNFISESMSDVLQSGFEMPINLLSSMLDTQSSSFQEFMNSIRKEAINRLNSESMDLSEILYEIETQGEKVISNGQNVLSTIIDGTTNTIIDTVDDVTETVLDSLDAQPSLFAWLVRSVQDAANPLLRGIPNPGEMPPTSNIMQMAIAPFQLGQDISSLSRVYPPLNRLLQYINQPAAAPAFLTLRSLLDEITETGTISGADRFPLLFSPFADFVSPLNFQLGISNAVLQYLDMLFS